MSQAKPSYKKEKYQDKLLNDINSLLRTRFQDARLQFVSITKVELNNDYSHAKIYWDTYDSNNRGSAKKAIEGIRGKLRSHLASILKVRYVPEIQLIYDSQYESEQAIMDILDSEASKGKYYRT